MGAYPLTPLSFSCFWREFLVHPSNELYQYPKKCIKKPSLPAVPRRGPEAGKSRKLNTHYLLNNKFSNCQLFWI